MTRRLAPISRSGRFLARAWNLVRHGYGSVTAGMVLRALLQAGLTIVLARFLGRSDYGLFVAVASITGLFSVLAGLGASALHLRDASIDSSTWRSNFVLHHRRISKSQIPLALISIGATWLVVRGDVQWMILVALVLGDILGIPASELLMRSYQGRGRYIPMALVMCSLPAIRFSALVSLLVLDAPIRLSSWAWISLTSGASMVAITSWFSWKSAGLRQRHTQRPGGTPSGLGFALSAASTRIHADADKAIIARLSSPGMAGDYSLAYRLVDVLLLPIYGMLEWSVRSLFRSGQKGFRVSFECAWKRWAVLMLMALISSLATYLLAPVLPVVFGPQYIEAVAMGHWLCFLPVTTASWMILRSTAATSGYQSAVGAVELFGTAITVALGVVLVSLHGWRGAVLATYLTQVIMIFSLPVFVFLNRFRYWSFVNPSRTRPSSAEPSEGD